MKVVSGKIKGRTLKTLKGLDIRPTPDKVKESLFNIFGERIVDKRFLDLFAGSGNIGIEALSRGAKEVCFVDNDKRSVRLIKENLRNCKIEDGFEVFLKDVNDFIRSQKKKFDLIFLDPPYATDLGEKALEEISKADILENDGLVILEHFHKRKIKKEYHLLRLQREKRLGDTCLSFFMKG